MDIASMLRSSAAAPAGAGDRLDPLTYPVLAGDFSYPSLVDDTESPAPPSDSIRRAMRRIAAGITVLTINRNGQRHGTTVSAIMPISGNPLVVGACLRASSGFTAMAMRERFFSVNVLEARQAMLAARFADPGRQPGDGQFAHLRWVTDGFTGAPLIEGCLAYLSCEVADCLRIGDHDLLIARAVAGTHRFGAPLLSYAGRISNDATDRPTSQRSDAQ
jgi:flavin reductase (DIM6/NTAB) family NADH-FMN oxidoreductase RutF